jgi:phosphatidylglycerophosphatase A
VRRALATGHPLDLLGMVSWMIEAAKPDPLAAYVKSRQQRDPVRLDDLVAGFIGVPIGM